jgi:hypothetical protein
VRLKVAYRSPESLLGQYTRSVGQGSVALHTQRELPVGTRFVFEMSASGVDDPLEVEGEVVRVVPLARGGYQLQVAYEAPRERAGVERVLQYIFENHRTERKRRHPRIPLFLRASDGTASATQYVLRDLSRGGAGFDVESFALPACVCVGSPFLLEMDLPLGALALFGEVAWTSASSATRERVVPATFGVRFGQLRSDSELLLERLLALRSLPAPPWQARVAFGLDAVTRMPG